MSVFICSTKNSLEVYCFLFDSPQSSLDTRLLMAILNINKLFVYTINVPVSLWMMQSFNPFGCLFGFHFRGGNCLPMTILLPISSIFSNECSRFLECNILFSDYSKFGLSFSQSLRLLPHAYFWCAKNHLFHSNRLL